MQNNSFICHTLISTSLDIEQAVLARNACTAICVSSMFLRSSQQEMAQWCPSLQQELSFMISGFHCNISMILVLLGFYVASIPEV